MSKLIVEVCQVSKVWAHPNADRMALAKIKGWQTCIKKDQKTGVTEFNPGDKCVFFPPDTVMPVELSNRFGITKFLKPIPLLPGQTERSHFRVAGTSLRGSSSDGFAAVPDNPNWPLGLSVVDHYGVSKWSPPDDNVHGDMDVECFRFLTYKAPENIGNFFHTISVGEMVSVSVKIDGEHVRNGRVKIPNEEDKEVYEYKAGSYDAMRKVYRADGKMSAFWRPFYEVEGLKELIDYLCQDEHDVIVHGQVYGPEHLSRMPYGIIPGQQGYKAFDICVDGNYLDHAVKTELFARFNVPCVPYLYVGPFNLEKIEKLTYGPNTLCTPDRAGLFKDQEGVVITPLVEKIHPDINGGRVILKSVSSAFRDYSGNQIDKH